MELLSDENASEMSAKEIMRQWEQRGKLPLAVAPTSSPGNQGGKASRKDQRNAPQITQADNNHQAYASEASIRPPPLTGGQSYNSQGSPALGSPNPPYAQNSQDRTSSPHRNSYRSSAYQKPAQIGAG